VYFFQNQGGNCIEKITGEVESGVEISLKTKVVIINNLPLKQSSLMFLVGNHSDK
jgi:hypothetical protein